jgi:hypothetical protein
VVKNLTQALNSTPTPDLQSHYEKLAKLILSLYRLKGKSISTSIIDFAKEVLSIARRYCVEANLYSKNRVHCIYCSFGNERGVKIYFKVIGAHKGNKVMIKHVIITDIMKIFEWREDEEWAKREYEEQYVETNKAVKRELEARLLNVKLPKKRKEVAKIIENAVNEVLNKLGGCMYSGFVLRDVKVFVSDELVNGVRHILASVVCGYDSYAITIEAPKNSIESIKVLEDVEFDPHCYLYGDLDEECWE